MSLMFSCAENKDGGVSGTLIYTDGSGSLDAIIFSNPIKDINLYKNSEESSVINSIVLESDFSILFDECDEKHGCVIKRYSLDEGSITDLRSGSMVGYIYDHEKILFYDELESNEVSLFSSDVKNINKSKKIHRKPEPYIYPNGIRQSLLLPPVPVSDHEVIFIGEDKSLFVYSANDGKVSSLNADHCLPILWRSATNQLLCSSFDSQKIFLLDVALEKVTFLSELSGGYGFSYIADTDSLIFGKMYSKFIVAENYGLFIYNFSNNKVVKVKDNLHVSKSLWVSQKLKESE
jgi:hypothetical protein